MYFLQTHKYSVLPSNTQIQCTSFQTNKYSALPFKQTNTVHFPHKQTKTVHLAFKQIKHSALPFRQIKHSALPFKQTQFNTLFEVFIKVKVLVLHEVHIVYKQLRFINNVKPRLVHYLTTNYVPYNSFNYTVIVIHQGC